jgi:hypothetical protein
MGNPKPTMAPTLQQRSTLIAIVAFLERAFWRTLGREQNPQYGEDIVRRSTRFLNLLDRDEKSLAFKIALENLRREWDLLNEEAALVPEGLELQRKAVELAGRYEIADVLVRDMLTQPPIARLFNAILADAVKAGATQVKFDFTPDQVGFSVQMKVGLGWTEMMYLPAILQMPLRGVIARVEDIGYEVLRPRLESKSPMPTALEFSWIDRQQLMIVSYRSQR